MLRPRFVLALVPIVVLAPLLVVQPLSIQGAPAAQQSPLEVISDAPVCVRFYPATGETREGSEICNTRPGDPPPPVVSPTGATTGATRPGSEHQDTPGVLTTAATTAAARTSPDPAPLVNAVPDDSADAKQLSALSGLGDWWRRLITRRRTATVVRGTGG